jgi:hypothetical protein
MPLDSTNSTVKRFISLSSLIGRAQLSSLYPNDFEYYICSLELVNSSDKTEDFFVFPIMPEQIVQKEPSITNIRKTVGGIISLSTSAFVPIDITLKGNFGRRFKFLVGRNNVDAAAINFKNLRDAQNQLTNAIFDTQIKTGYGCIKILQSIIQKSKKLDDFGNPYRLYFYNPAIGDNYIVKALEITFSQVIGQSNMIWNYNLIMKAISPIYGVLDDNGKNSLSKTMQYSIISKGLDILKSAVGRELNNQVFKRSMKLSNENLEYQKLGVSGDAIYGPYIK